MERKVIITMNLSVLLGRLVHAPELQKKKKDDSMTYWCRFRIAVDREYAKGTRSYFTELIVADCQIIDFADRESTDSKKEKENQV